MAGGAQARERTPSKSTWRADRGARPRRHPAGWPHPTRQSTSSGSHSLQAAGSARRHAAARSGCGRRSARRRCTARRCRSGRRSQRHSRAPKGPPSRRAPWRPRRRRGVGACA
eukprot:1912848-Prymnesium_polylepis.1